MSSQPRRECVLRRLASIETVKEAGPAAVREGYLEEAVTKDGQDFSKMASGNS